MTLPLTVAVFILLLALQYFSTDEDIDLTYTQEAFTYQKYYCRSR